MLQVCIHILFEEIRIQTIFSSCIILAIYHYIIKYLIAWRKYIYTFLFYLVVIYIFQHKHSVSYYNYDFIYLYYGIRGKNIFLFWCYTAHHGAPQCITVHCDAVHSDALLAWSPPQDLHLRPETRTHTHTHIHLHMHSHKHIHKLIFTAKHLYIQIHTHTHTYIYIYI